MSFLSGVFSGSNGANFNAGTIQGGALGQSSAQDASQLGGVNQGIQNIAQNGSGLAQAQLQQATNQNIAQNAGMISSQKGLNPALAARQASENAAQTGQTAANQSAALQAQTQMAAQGQLSSNLLGQQGIYQNAIAQQNAAQAGIAGINATTQGKITGGFLSGAGLGAAAANGGMVPSFADGGMAGPQSMAGQMMAGGMPSAPMGSNFFQNPTPMRADPSTQVQAPAAKKSSLSDDPITAGGQAMGKAIGSGISSMFSSGNPTPMAAAQGGRVPALVSPGERYLPPAEVKKVASGQKSPMKAGEKIPGNPKVPGNSYANDTVPKTLQSGGIVIPNSVMQSKNPAKEASKFVAAILAKQRS
jgi:hypothetical protein